MQRKEEENKDAEAKKQNKVKRKKVWDGEREQKVSRRTASRQRGAGGDGEEGGVNRRPRWTFRPVG